MAYLLPHVDTQSRKRYREMKNEPVWPRHALSQTIGMPQKWKIAPPASVRIELGKNSAAHAIRLSDWENFQPLMHAGALLRVHITRALTGPRPALAEVEALC